MSTSQIEILELSEASLLLTARGKKIIRESLPRMTPKQLEAARGALLREYTIIADACKDTIDQRIRMDNDGQFVAALKEFFRKTDRGVRHVKEGEERDEENRLLSSLDIQISTS